MTYSTAGTFLPTMIRKITPALAFALVLLAAVGCNGTLEQRIQRADLVVGAAADSVRIGIQSGHLKGDTATAAKFGVNGANDALVKVHAAYKAGDQTGARFWLERIAEFMAKVPTEAK